MYNYNLNLPSVYNYDVDLDTQYGMGLGFMRRPFVGGACNSATNSPGSRSYNAIYCGAVILANVTTRGCRITVLSWGGDTYRSSI
jgi:hypothetical protein